MDLDSYGLGRLWTGTPMEQGIIYIIYDRSTLMSERDRKALNGTASNKRRAHTAQTLNYW